MARRRCETGQVELSSSVFWPILLCSAAVLALWLDARFPKLAVGTLQGAVLHAAASLLVITLIVPGVAQLVLGPQTLLAIEAAAIGIVLPGFTYALLACLWLVKVGHRALAGELR